MTAPLDRHALAYAVPLPRARGSAERDRHLREASRQDAGPQRLQIFRFGKFSDFPSRRKMITDATTTAEPATKSAKRGKVRAVNATTLAAHLGISRQRVIDERVIDRLADVDGFDQDASRLRYLDWLRGRSPKSKAESAFLREKTKALELRNEERLSRLVPREVLEDAIDIIVGMHRAELGGLPASFTRDVSEATPLRKTGS